MDWYPFRSASLNRDHLGSDLWSMAQTWETLSPERDAREASGKRGVGRTLLPRSEAVFVGLSQALVVMAGLLLLAPIGRIDAVTGPFAVAIFLLVPIGVVTCSRGRWVGVVMAGVAATAWCGVEHGAHARGTSARPEEARSLA